MKIVRKAGIALAIIALIVVILLLVLQTPPVRRYVLSKVQSALAQRGINLKASGLDYNLFAVSATLQNVVISSARQSDLPPVARIDRVYVNLAALPLLHGNFHITDAELDRPNLDVVMAASGTSNIPSTDQSNTGASSGSSNPAGAIFLIDHLEVNNGSFALEDKPAQMSLKLPQWQFHIQLSTDSSARQLSFFTAQSGQVVLKGRTLPIQKIQFNAEVNTQQAQLHEAKLQLANSTISFRGQVTNLASPRLDLHGQAELAMKELAKFAGVNQPVAGKLHMQLGLTGPVSTLRAKAQVSSDGLRYEDIRSIQLDADATWNRAAQRVHLSQINIHSSAGGVQAHGEVALTAAAGESSLQAQIESLNLRSITQILQTKLKVASRANGTVHLTWPGIAVRQASGRGMIHFVALERQPRKNVLPLSGDITAILRDGKITLSVGQPPSAAIPADYRMKWPFPHVQEVNYLRRGRVRDAVFHPGISRACFIKVSAPEYSLSLPASALARLLAAQNSSSSPGSIQAIEALATLLRGRITLSPNGHISGNLHAHVANINDLLQKLSSFQGGSQPVKVPVQGAADVYADIAGTIRTPQVKLRLSAPSLQMGNLHSVTVELKGEYRAPKFVIERATAYWKDGSLVASGSLSTKQNGPLNLDVHINNVSLDPILQAIGKGNVPVAGVISASAHVEGTLQDPTATISANGQQLVAYGEAWGKLDLQAHLANQRIQVDELQLQRPSRNSGTLRMTGSYGLKDKSYSLHLQADGVQIEQLKLPNGMTVQGTIELNAEGNGTTENPSLHANLNATGLSINQQKLGSLSAKLNVADQRAHIQLNAPDLNLATTADVGIHRPYPATFSVDANQVDLAKLPLPASAKQLSGMITAHLQGTGNLQHPRELNATLNMQQFNISRGALNMHSSGPMDVSYKQQILTVQPFSVIANGAELKVSGRLPLQPGKKAASMHVNGTLDLQAARDLVPQLKSLRARGQVQLDMTVSGSLTKLIPDGTITLQNGSFSGPKLPSPVRNLNVNLQLHNGVAELQQAQADFAGGTIRASGSLPLGLLPAKLPIYTPPVTNPAQFSFAVSGLQLEKLPSIPGGATGKISFRLDARAAKLALADLTAQLRFDDLNVSLHGTPIQQEGNSIIRIENGQATVQHFHLKGPDTEINVEGTSGLTASAPIHLNVHMKTNAALASSFVSGAKITGNTEAEVTVNGTLASPDLQGYVTVQDGQFAITDPTLGVTDLDLRINLKGNRIQLAQLKGTLNGGELSGGGGFNFSHGSIQNSDLHAIANNVYFNYPEGLRTVSNVDLNLKSQQDVNVLGGQVTVLEGSFRRYINLQGQVLNFLQTGNSGLNLIGKRNAFLSSLQFNIGVKTKSPLLIENNVAQAAVVANLKLVGGYYRPSVTGNVQLEETGQLYLNGNTFYIDTGTVNFTSEQRIEANLNIVAEAKVDNYDITMQVQGPAGKIKTTLTSDPPLSEQDIVSVLLFGQPLQQTRGAEVNVASQELLAYVAGGLGSALSNQLQRAAGLSEVRVEPVLIAGETDPSARLTIGQYLTSALKLTYSMNMIDAGDQIWIGEYDFTRRFTSSITKQSDNSYRFDLNNDWRFGGTPLAVGGANRKITISALHFTGNTNLSDKQLENRMKVKPGQKYDFFKIQKGTERLQHYYNKQHQLEARVRVNTQRENAKANVQVRVEPGPKVRFIYEGWSAPHSVKERVTDIWQRGVFDLQRAQDSVAAIRTYLVNHGYLEAKINYQIHTPSSDDKEVVFDIQSGERFQNVRITFPGAKRFSDEDLLNVLRKANLRNQLLNEPTQVRSLLQNYYYDHGYLTATIKNPDVRVNRQQNTGVIAIPVHEGPQYHIRNVQFQGNSVFSNAKLTGTAELSTREVYKPSLDSPAIMRLQDLYWNDGYNDMNVQLSVKPFRKTSEVDLTFQIQEGKQQILHKVLVSGTEETSPSLIRGQLTVQPGKPLSSEKLAKSQSNLYDTGAFQVVEFNRNVLPREANMPESQVPTDLAIHVHEVQPYRFQYGGYYDTDRGPGVIVNMSNYNTLGDARVVGLQARYDADLQDARLYFSQPLLRRFPVSTIGGPFYTRNVHEAFIDDHIGATIGQEARFRHHYVLDYSYRLERTRIFNLTDVPLTGLGPGMDGETSGTTGNGVEGIGNTVTVPPYGSISRRLSPLTVTLTRDTRDDVLDATKGLFFSQGLSTAFNFMGSQDQYMKYFGQYFQFIPLGKPVPVPFKPNLKRPRFIYAGAIRLGIAGGFGGEDLIQSERFFAGGGTTIRGFSQDSVGPADQNGIPVGGDALFILNNEVRFPLISIFDGAGFIDIGNVYLKPSDFNPLNVRESAGFGIRVHTPWVLIRADYGIKLDRKPGESFGQFFISIGQAF